MMLWKEKKSVKYTVGGLDFFCRAANAMNVTYNMLLVFLCVRVCVHVQTRRQQNVCVVAECVTEGMPHLSSACEGSLGCPCGVSAPSCLWDETVDIIHSLIPDNYSDLNTHAMHRQERFF